MKEPDSRKKSIRIEDLSDRQVMAVLLAISFAASFISLLIHRRLDAEWWESWFENFSTEMFGAFMTFWLLEIVVDKRREKERKLEEQEQFKQRLIYTLRSTINVEACRAVEELGANGWLKDGSLEGIKFSWGKLAGAKLAGGRLAGAQFYHTDLEGAKLWKADLRGANLLDAYLKDAKIENTLFDEDTILPDKSPWTPDKDLRRFTDPTHPQFWKPDWV
jgi:hypothetical protein